MVEIISNPKHTAVKNLPFDCEKIVTHHTLEPGSLLPVRNNAAIVAVSVDIAADSVKKEPQLSGAEVAERILHGKISDAVLIARVTEQIADQIGGPAPCRGSTHAAQTALNAVADQPHVTLATIQFDAVVIGQIDEIAENLGVTTETADGRVVIIPANAVVPTLQIAADQIVPAQSNRPGTLNENSMRTVRVRIEPRTGPGCGRVNQIMLDQKFPGVLDADSGQIVDNPIIEQILAIPLPSDTRRAESGDVAAADDDMSALQEIDSVISPSSDRKLIENNVVGLVDPYRLLTIESSVQHKSRSRRIADVAVRTAGLPDNQRQFAVLRVKDNCPGDGEPALPCSKRAGITFPRVPAADQFDLICGTFPE